ncbi:hypothetical protein QVD17_21207 [Tagetes erecta]|uniref:Uncharacterized protein n=1 Tax=Tagetes erecta TaxID=13708 RepID=A0AAD8KRG2_TARER|nr:hypothetical protein QVD17_21207 [Tagetes erecta]
MDSLFLEQAWRYQDKILAEAEKEGEKEERTATITSLDELQLRPRGSKGQPKERRLMNHLSHHHFYFKHISSLFTSFLRPFFTSNRRKITVFVSTMFITA